MMQSHLKYQDLTSTEDINIFLDTHRGKGIPSIIKQQFLELYAQDDQFAFSSLGNFIDLTIKYHQTHSKSKEIKDDVVYIELEEMLAAMAKNPEYIEYTNYLQDKVQDMKDADLHTSKVHR